MVRLSDNFCMLHFSAFACVAAPVHSHCPATVFADDVRCFIHKLHAVVFIAYLPCLMHEANISVS